jgi:hypothetical protein
VLVVPLAGEDDDVGGLDGGVLDVAGELGVTLGDGLGTGLGERDPAGWCGAAEWVWLGGWV